MTSWPKFCSHGLMLFNHNLRGNITMNTEHTPGPWSEPVIYGANSFFFEIRSTDLRARQIAIVNRIEDASLISAAPDMLDALQVLFEHCAMVHNKWVDESNQKQADAVIQSARAAIPKAKGEK